MPHRVHYTLAAFLGAFMLASTGGAAYATTPVGLTYQVARDIVGKGSTGTIGGGGNPIYLANGPQYSGVVGISFIEGGQSEFCSGSLSANRQSVITAGHCGYGVNSTSVKVYFSNPSLNPTDVSVYAAGAPGVTTVDVSHVFVDPTYTANRNANPNDFVDDTDIAVFRLATAAPLGAIGYSLNGGTDLTGVGFNTAGYGLRSDAGGSVGADLGAGHLRQGDNTYVFALGDPDFHGYFKGYFGNGDDTNTFIAELDDGTTTHDGACRVAGAFGLGGPKYCTLGGPTQVLIAPGDSGGPQFVNGQLASITSFGISFGQNFGDIDGTVDSSFGELAGFVPIYSNLEFLDSALNAPEPATWAMMLVGFGMLGGAMRKRRGLLTT